MALLAGAIERYTEPSEDGRPHLASAQGAALKSEALPEFLIPVDAVLG